MTIKEIAKLANVSLGTVDRVLHKRGRVAKKTEDKILKIIEQVNYKPNIYARGLVLNKTYTIIALLPFYEEGDYWELPAKGIHSAGDHLAQYGIALVICYFDQNSATSFKEQAAKVLSLKPDGVVLAPVINFEAVKFAIQLSQHHIPFTLIDSDIAHVNALSFIGQNAFQSGYLAAKLLCSSFKTPGTILIVTIKNNENHNKTLQLRTEGFKDYLLKSSIITEVSIEEFNVYQSGDLWKSELKSICNDKDSNIRGIYVPSSKVHYVAACLEAHNKFETVLVGNDLIAQNIPYVAEGVIDYVIGQRPETQGFYALDFLYRHLIIQQDIERTKYLPLDIITKENLQYYFDEISQD
ncbi:substrate-binding domain-containing protein [Zhouia sp. PK063]|uniref:substrate-binding domain-containing protein n=1 Tax=Zhouia sp. PK063 TaxID=3373602 RepID=UPI00378AAF8F